MLSLIVAIDNQGGISKNDQIPWKIKEDFQFFSDVTSRNYSPAGTSKNALIMGKNTWLTCEIKDLKNRLIIVVSSTLVDSNVYIVKTLTEAIKYCQEQQLHVFICGGKGIYDEAINDFNIDYIYLTRINSDYE